MASTNNRRKASSSKKGGRTQGKNRKKADPVEAFTNEVILLIILALAIILMVSNFGVGGFVGNAISSFFFGLFGLLSYIFPLVLFVSVAFFMSNRRNPLAYKKLLAGFCFYGALCALMQLLTEGYLNTAQLFEFFENSAKYHTGGGIVGGVFVKICAMAFGVVGAYILVFLVLIIALIIMTQRSFLGFFRNIFGGMQESVKRRQEKLMEERPMREALAQEKAQEKARIRAQKAEEKARLKEERQAMKSLDLEKEEGSEEIRAEEKPVKKRKTRAEITAERARIRAEKRRMLMEEDDEGAFLEGTKISVPGSEEEPEEPSQMKFEIHRSEPVAEEEPDFDLDLDLDLDFDPKQEEEPVKEAEAIPEPIQATKIETMPVSKPQTDQMDPNKNFGQMPSFLKEAPSVAVARKKEANEAEAMASEPAMRQQAPSHERNPRSSKEEIHSGIENIKKEIGTSAPPKREHQFPPLSLLKKGKQGSTGDSDEYLRKTAQKLQTTLHNFGVEVTVTNVSCGPTVTRYELQPEQGVKVSKIVNLTDDIKLNLATSDIRIEAPIPGKAAVGIEVPNKENSAVMLRDLLASREFQESKSKLAFAAGKDIAGKPVVTDIAKMPHLLIAGATGSGKSVCINTLIMSILYKANPDDVKLIMIDPKVVELSVYNGIPHLLIPVVTDPKKAAGALNWAVAEMTDRYNTFAEYNVRSLQDYNKKLDTMTFGEDEKVPQKMPQIVIIVDELADLMMVAPGEVEDAICRLAQLARAAGIHLVIATQRPSVNVITGLIKANMPSRIAFSVSSGVDSRTILDMNGAEKLLGKGDMLFYPQGYQKPARLQGAFVSDEEVSAVVEFLSRANPASTAYNEEIQQKINTAGFTSGAAAASGEEKDAYFLDAGKFIIEKEKASIGMLQRVFKIGFNRAARIMDQLAEAGVVGPEEGTKPRKILMTMEEFQQYIEETL